MPSIGIFILFYIRTKAVNHSSICKTNVGKRALELPYMNDVNSRKL
jgi:hypothetical protein